MKDLNFNDGDINAFGKMLQDAFEVRPKKQGASDMEGLNPKLSIESKGDGYAVNVYGQFNDVANMLAHLINSVLGSLEDEHTAQMLLLAYLTDCMKKMARKVRDSVKGDED